MTEFSGHTLSFGKHPDNMTPGERPVYIRHAPGMDGLGITTLQADIAGGPSEIQLERTDYNVLGAMDRWLGILNDLRGDFNSIAGLRDHLLAQEPKAFRRPLPAPGARP